MADAKLFIIHQGALGDVVLTFAGLIALRKQFGRIDILCQGQVGKLATRLGLVDKAYALEAAYFATLFCGAADDKINTLIRSYDRIVIVSFSTERMD